jgi:uncharacterized protein involved in type VI secretion and phage assembly
VSPVPRSRSTDRRYYGVTEALVVDNADPDKEGRIKVRFPWFDDSMVTEWCRVSQLYAGNGYGSLLVPEVGDEVLVAFVHGDMRFPIVLGGLYNGKDKPSSHRDSSTDQKLLRTKGGHELLLDDSSSQQRVRVKTNGGHEVDLDDTGKKVSIKSSGGHEIELDDNGMTVTITDSSGQSVKLDATSITIQAAASVTVKAASVSIDASSIGLGSGASHPLVLGDIFMAMFNSHVHVAAGFGSPTGPPIPPMLPTVVSTVSRTT